MTDFINPSVEICTATERHLFASFIFRDHVYEILCELRRIQRHYEAIASPARGAEGWQLGWLSASAPRPAAAASLTAAEPPSSGCSPAGRASSPPRTPVRTPGTPVFPSALYSTSPASAAPSPAHATPVHTMAAVRADSPVGMSPGIPAAGRDGPADQPSGGAAFEVSPARGDGGEASLKAGTRDLFFLRRRRPQPSLAASPLPTARGGEASPRSPPAPPPTVDTASAVRRAAERRCNGAAADDGCAGAGGASATACEGGATEEGPGSLSADPLSHEVLSTTLPCSAAHARQVLFGNGSSFFADFLAAQGGSQIEMEPWSELRCGGGWLREVRRVQRVRSRFSPVRSTRVHETQRLGLAADGAVVLAIHQLSLDVPYADYFVVHTKMCLRDEPAESSRLMEPAAASTLVVTVAVTFSKPTLVQSRITFGALADLRHAYNSASLPTLRKFLTRPAGGGASAEGAPPRAAPADGVHSGAEGGRTLAHARASVQADVRTSEEGGAGFNGGCTGAFRQRGDDGSPASFFSWAAGSWWSGCVLCMAALAEAAQVLRGPGALLVIEQMPWGVARRARARLRVALLEVHYAGGRAALAKAIVREAGRLVVLAALLGAAYTLARACLRLPGYRAGERADGAAQDLKARLACLETSYAALHARAVAWEACAVTAASLWEVDGRKDVPAACVTVSPNAPRLAAIGDVCGSRLVLTGTADTAHQ